MLDVVAKLNDLLGPAARREAMLVFALVLLMAMVETVGVASIMPFIALLSNPGVLETNAYLSAAYGYFGFSSSQSFLFALGTLTLVLLVGSVVLRAAALWMQLRFVHMQTHEVASRLVGAYLRQPYEWFLNHRTTDIGANVLAEVTNVFQGVAFPVMLLFANAIVALLLMTLLVVVDPVLAVSSAVALGGVYVVVFLLARKFLERIGEVRVRSNRERHQALYETFTGVKDIKVAGVEASFLARFRQPSARMARASVSSALVSELPSFAMQAVVFGGMLLMMLYLMVAHGSLQDAIPVISLYALAGYRLLPTLQNTYRNVTAIKFSIPALEGLHRDMRAFDRDGKGWDAEAGSDAAAPPLRFSKTLEFRDVAFGYAGADRGVLERLNMTIEARTTVALVGATGAGKTTVVDLILGLLEPGAGALFVDGQRLDAGRLREWRCHIGYVPQAIFLSDDTIAANIAFGIPPDDIDPAAVERAARIANLHDFVVGELAAGYQTVVGERGIRLSGGQRQRIGIARALYHDPELLVFDEATSALDNVTEQAVMDAVYNLGHRKTIVLIAHRLSTVRACDRIHVLGGGRVTASGTYDELLAHSETFRAMARQDGGVAPTGGDKAPSAVAAGGSAR